MKKSTEQLGIILKSEGDNKNSGSEGFKEVSRRYKDTCLTIVETVNNYKIAMGHNILSLKPFRTIEDAEEWLDKCEYLDLFIGMAHVAAFNVISSLDEQKNQSK